MRKKGGMELSINAIVILIIAMVVLGIGILFIRGMFGKAQTTTFKALTAQETTVPASSDKPLVADKELEVSSSNPSATLQVSVYNPETSTQNATISLVRCVTKTGQETASGQVGFTEIANIPIKANTFSGFQAVLTVNEIGQTFVPSEDSLVCTIKSTLSNGREDTTSVVVKIVSS